MRKKNVNIDKGANVLLVIFTLLFFLMLGRFLYIQVGGTVRGVDIQAFTRDWFIDEGVLEGKRGSIYDAKGNALATQTLSYRLQAILTRGQPTYVRNPEQTAEQLANFIEMPEERIYEIIQQGREQDQFQVEFGTAGRDLSYSEMREIEAAEIPGIIFHTTTSRSYPKGVFASYILGYTTRVEEENDSDLVGGMGIESMLNDELTGEDGRVVFGIDRERNPVPSEVQEIVEPLHGNDVHLTINPTIQGFLEAAIRNAEESYSPEEVTGIVMEASTGRILAMASSPSFDPNVRDMSNFTNIAIESAFQPGSTMKIFTWAAAIDAGVYNGDSYFQSGSFFATPGGVPIRDINRVGWGSITFNEGFYRSSNVAAATIGMDLLGPERAMEYFNKFGLFDRTGIDLPGEAHGATAFQFPRDQAVTMLGQGSTTTAIAMVQGMSAIANDGEMMRPFVIEKIVNSNTDEVVQDNSPTVAGTPIRPETAQQMRSLLEGAVIEPMATGRAYQIEGFDVIGKTGTAELFTPEGQIIGERGNQLISFLGMAPKDNPEVIMYVSVKRPNLTEQQAMSQPSSEIFNYVMENTLHYLNIDKNITTETTAELANANSVEVGEYVGLSTENAIAEVEEKGLTPIVIGTGENIVAQLPTEEDTVIKGSRVFLLTNGNREMLDVRGWAVNDVMSLARLLEIDVEVEGSGFVTYQSIGVGESVQVGSTLNIRSEGFPE